MKRYPLFLLFPAILFLFFFSSIEKRGTIPLPDHDPKKIYERLETGEGRSLPPKDLFIKGYKGFRAAVEKGEVKKKILVLIDFRLSSKRKRMWAIDLEEERVRYHTLVAHGKGSGNEFPKSFSNKPGSHQSSLGFYSTGRTYKGKHGLSLKLDGLEEGINDKARERAIVMHSAHYVSKSFGSKYGRIGRSFGCPAVPVDVHKELFPFLKEGACLFVHYPEKNYREKSEYLP